MPAIADYRCFLRGLNAPADKVGVKIGYITPWQPDHPGFLQPQARDLQPQLAGDRAARLREARARGAEGAVLRADARARQPRRPAGAARLRRRGGRVRRRAAAGRRVHRRTPRPACLIGEPGRRGRPPQRVNPASAARSDPFGEVLAALDARGCAKPKQLWIAGTGTFDHRCEAMSAALVSRRAGQPVDVRDRTALPRVARRRGRAGEGPAEPPPVAS